MNYTVDDQNMAFISQLYPDVYTQIVQPGLSFFVISLFEISYLFI